MPLSRVRAAAGYLAVLATAPYLSLKLVWLSGSTFGIADPAVALDPSLRVLNAATAALDVVAVVVALAFTHSWGMRIPAPLVLVPTWIGIGLLAPIAVALPATAFTATPAADFLDPWVRPLVYGGFTVQGIALLVAFALHARTRWPEFFEVRTAGVRRGATHAVQVVLAGGVAAVAVLVGLLDLAWAAGVAVGLPDGVHPGAMTGVHGVFALLTAAGLLVMVHRVGRGRFRVPLAVTWVSAGSMTAWGSWGLVNALGSTVLAGDASLVLPHLADLARAAAGVLAGVTALVLLAEHRNGPIMRSWADERPVGSGERVGG